MSRPQFRKRSPEGFRVDSQIFMPSYSRQTGQQVTISGSPAACARHYMRRSRSQYVQEQAARIVARNGLPPTPESLARVRLKLEAEMRRTTLLLTRPRRKIR